MMEHGDGSDACLWQEQGRYVHYRVILQYYAKVLGGCGKNTSDKVDKCFQKYT